MTMAESMIDRLGLHLAREEYGGAADHLTALDDFDEADRFRQEAREIIRVMREPTKAMMDASWEHDAWCYNEGQAPQPDLYRAQIDAGLGEDTG